MLDTVSRYIAAVHNPATQRALRGIVRPGADRLSTQSLNSAGLAIHGSASALAKTGASDYYASVKGRLVTVAAGTDMPALTGINITAANYNVACFFIDGAGTVTVAAGTQATAIGNVLFPPFPESKALIGFLLITYASTFTGGTTALDTATTVYINTPGAFDPSVLL